MKLSTNNTLIAIILLFLCSTSCTYAQNKYISILAVDSEHYAVLNNAQIPFTIITTQRKRERTTVLPPGEKQYFHVSDIDHTSTITLVYEYKDWEQQLMSDIRKLMSYGMEHYYEKVLTDELKKRDMTLVDPGERDDYIATTVNGVGNFAKDILTTWYAQYLNERYKEKAKLICDNIIYHTDLLNASNGEDNGERPNFEPIYVLNALKTQERYGEYPNPDNLMNISFTLGKSGFDPYWNNGASGTFNEVVKFNPSYDFWYAKRVWRGFRWHEDISSSFYLWAGYDRYVHDLDNKDKPVYVGKNYVKNPQYEYYKINTEDQINFRTSQLSTGILLRTYVFNKLSASFGVGYIFTNWSSIYFENGTNHLGGTIELKKNRIFGVSNNKSSAFYKMIKLSRTVVCIDSPNTVDFFLVAKFWDRELSPSRKFQLYEYSEEGTYTKIPITGGRRSFLTINFGVSFNW